MYVFEDEIGKAGNGWKIDCNIIYPGWVVSVTELIYCKSEISAISAIAIRLFSFFSRFSISKLIIAVIVVGRIFY